MPEQPTSRRERRLRTAAIGRLLLAAGTNVIVVGHLAYAVTITWLLSVSISRRLDDVPVAVAFFMLFLPLALLAADRFVTKPTLRFFRAVMQRAIDDFERG